MKNVSSSPLAMNLAKWIFSIVKFHKVNKIVKYKKEQLAIVEKKSSSVMKDKFKQDLLRYIESSMGN